MFSPVSVCLSVCLSVNRITQKLLIIFLWNYMVGHNPRTNLVDFWWLSKGQNRFLRITPLRIESWQKLKCSLFSSINDPNQGSGCRNFCQNLSELWNSPDYYYYYYWQFVLSEHASSCCCCSLFTSIKGNKQAEILQLKVIKKCLHCWCPSGIPTVTASTGVLNMVQYEKFAFINQYPHLFRK